MARPKPAVRVWRARFLIEGEFEATWGRYVDRQLGLGCWGLGGKGWGGQSEAGALAVLEEAWEAGYRHFDTAAAYGASETILGRFLATRRDHDCFVASKVYPGPDSSRIRETVLRSLERLQLGKVRLYYLHWPRSDEAVEADVEALASCVEEGLVGAIGVSNYSVDQLERANAVSKTSVYQGPYSLLWRSVEDGILPACERMNIRFVGYGSLGEGLLSGKIKPQHQFPSGDHRRNGWLFNNKNGPLVSGFIEALEDKSRAEGFSLSEVALQWVLSQRGVSATLAGARRPRQAASNKLAEKVSPSKELFEWITKQRTKLEPIWRGRAHYFGQHP